MTNSEQGDTMGKNTHYIAALEAEMTDDGHTINIGVPDHIGPDTDAYDHARMAERIRRWLPAVGGASVGTLSTTVEVDHRTMSRILAAAEVNGPEVDRLRAVEEWARDADHHPGCSGGYPSYRCKCGRAELFPEEADRG